MRRRFQQSVPLTIAILLCAPMALAAPPVTALAFSPDGATILSASQAGVELHEWPDLKVSRRLPSQLPHVHDLAFSPDGKALAVAGGAPGEAGTLEVFSWPESKLQFRSQLHADLIYGVAWSPDGTHLATAGYDHAVLLVDPGSGRRLQKLEGHSRGVLAVCFLPDGKSLLSGSADQAIRVWDIASGRQVRSLDNHTGTVHQLALRPSQPDGSPPMVASLSDDRTVRFWQPTLGRMVRFARFKSAPTAGQWSGDGKWLIAAFADGRVRVIDPDTAEVVAEARASDNRIHSLALLRKTPLRAVVGDARGKLTAVPIHVAEKPQ
jgi:WD40 repeat protein